MYYVVALSYGSNLETKYAENVYVLNLFSLFQSLSQVMNASMEELARCPGIGERKVLHSLTFSTFHCQCCCAMCTFVMPFTGTAKTLFGVF